jgi:hypothetical protein
MFIRVPAYRVPAGEGRADGLPFVGTWTFEVSPEDGASRLTITEHGEVYHPLFRSACDAATHLAGVSFVI